MKISAERNVWGNGVSIRMAKIEPSSMFVAEPIEFKARDEGEYVTPCLELNINDAQLLIDELWQCGLRPSEGTGSAGSLKATEKHLEDMRKIAFKFLETSNGPV